MFALDQTLVGTYHIASLRKEASRAAQARVLAPHRLRGLGRRLAR